MFGNIGQDLSGYVRSTLRRFSTKATAVRVAPAGGYIFNIVAGIQNSTYTQKAGVLFYFSDTNLYTNSNYLKVKYFIYITRQERIIMTKIGYISKEQFEKSPELKAQYGSYEKFQLAQLKSQSVYTFAQNKKSAYNPAKSFFDMRMQAYKEHNEESERLIENYKKLEAKYKALLGQQISTNATLQRKYKVSSNNDLVSAMNDKNALYDQGVYNNSAKSVNEAYQAFVSALQTANYQTHRIV